MESPKRYIAEFLGTLLLVFFGVGSAIAALVEGGVVVVALTFGFILLVLGYVLVPVSGSHLNPAVTLGVLLSGKISMVGAVAYWIAQLLGSVAASFILWALVHWGGVTDQTGRLGANSYGTNINLGGAMVLETIISFLFVLAVLVVTSRTNHPGVASVVMGVALAVTHLIATTLDGTSVNPARSFGPALFNVGKPLGQLWLFILFPLLGGLLAALAAPLVRHGSGAPDNPPPPRPAGGYR